MNCEIYFFNTLASGCFWGLKKMPKHTWLCAGTSPLLYRWRTWLKRQKTWKSF